MLYFKVQHNVSFQTTSATIALLAGQVYIAPDDFKDKLTQSLAKDIAIHYLTEHEIQGIVEIQPFDLDQFSVLSQGRVMELIIEWSNRRALNLAFIHVQSSARASHDDALISQMVDVLHPWLELMQKLDLGINVYLDCYANESAYQSQLAALFPKMIIRSRNLPIQQEMWGKYDLVVCQRYVSQNIQVLASKGGEGGRVKVVIPHYGSDAVLNECLQALKYIKEISREDIIIIDNNNDNVLFTIAVNKGIKLALQAGADFVWILNNDTQPKSDYIEHTLNRFFETPHAGIVGGKNVSQENPDYIFWGGSFQSYPWGKHKTGFVSQGHLSVASIESWATFSSVIIKRDVFEKIGLLDETMKFICSDSDFSFSAREAGFEIWYEPRSVVFHYIGASCRTPSSLIEQVKYEDQMAFASKWAQKIGVPVEALTDNGINEYVANCKGKELTQHNLSQVVSFMNSTRSLESAKARARRIREGFFEKYCQGIGIDLGYGGDLLCDNCIGFDQKDGDIQYLGQNIALKYDFVHSSHSLEHMIDPGLALRNWWNLLKPGGYLLISVPHRDLYEKRLSLPSRWNSDHKFFFVPFYQENMWTLGIKELIEKNLLESTIVSLKICDEGHTINNPDIHSDGEYSIEVVVKKAVLETDHSGCRQRNFERIDSDYKYEKIFPLATFAPWLSDELFNQTYGCIQAYTLVDKYRCYELWKLVEESSKLEGALIEVGVWRGGTGALIAKKAKICGLNEKVFLCDTFSGVVKTSSKDSFYFGGEHSDASKASVEEIIRMLQLENVEILVGVFPEVTGSLIQDKVFCFCHVDVDVYQSAKDILQWIWPKLVIGGILVFDDYGFQSCNGITTFVNEERCKDDRIVIHNLNGHAVFVKIADEFSSPRSMFINKNNELETELKADSPTRLFVMRPEGSSKQGLFDLIRDLPNAAIMAEVGCYAGESTGMFRDSNKFKKIICIDPYIANYQDANEVLETLTRAKESLLSMLDDTMEFLQMTFEDADSHIANDSLDFCYIDADHSYEAVKKDILLAIKKVKIGAYLGGHDYFPACGVFRAVDELINTQSFSRVKFYRDTSWMVKVTSELKNALSKRPIIYDCFTFFNELDLLEIRFNILNDVVDKFVLVEATRTYSNLEKPLYFNENKERYQKYKNKIIHVIVDDYPEFVDAWTYERHQRKCISRGLANCTENDFVMISDLDEIINPDILVDAIKTDNPKCFDQRLFYYFLNCEERTLVWSAAAIVKYHKDTFNAQEIRMEAYYQRNSLWEHCKNAGWHFSCLGGVEGIQSKLKSFSHQEYNTDYYLDPKRIANKIKSGEDLIDGRGFKFQVKKIDDSFPRYLFENSDRYRHLICWDIQE